MNAARKAGPLRMLAIGLGGLVVLAGALWAAVATMLPPARVRTLVERQLTESLSRPVRFEGASVSLFPPVRLSARGVRIAEPRGFAAGEALQVPEIGFDLDAIALIRRELRVRRLVFKRPLLHLVIFADGTTNFDRMMKPAAEGSAAEARRPLDLDIAELQVQDARVILDRVASGTRTVVELDSRLSFSSREGGRRLATAGHTTLDGLAAGPLSATRVSDLDGSLARLVWTLDHEGVYEQTTRRLALGRLDLAFGRTRVALQGRVDDLGATPRLDLRTRAQRVDLGEVLRALSVADAQAVRGISGSGELSFDLAIRGRVAPRRTPVVTGTLGVRNGSFRYPGSGTSVDRLSFDARFAPDSFGIPNAVGRVAGQPVRASLEVRQFADPRVRFAVRGDVDLAAVAPMFAPRNTRLSGHADVNLGGAGRARDPGNLALTGQARLFNVGVSTPEIPEPIEKIHGELGFSSLRASVKGLTLQAGKSTLAFDGTVTRPLALMKKPGETPPATVDFRLRSPLLDAKEFLPEGGGGPMLLNANGGGIVEIQRLRNGRLDVSNVNARVTLDPAVMAVPSFGFDGYGGTVRGSGRFDYRDPALPETRLDAVIDSVEADVLLSHWTGARDFLRGSMSTTLDLGIAGTTPEQLKRTLTAVGNASIANGSLGPGPVLEGIARVTGMAKLEQLRFRDVRAPFRVERGRVVTDPVAISGPYGDWTAIGAIGLDGSLDYAVSITLPREIAERLGARSAIAAGALSDAEGRVLIDLRVRGTAKKPQVALDGAAMRDRLAGRASQAIAEQREKIEESILKRLPGAVSPLDSLRSQRDSLAQAARDSVRRAARNVLEGFFRPRKGAAPDTAK